MYKIKTSDEKEHGPYLANVVQQWVAAGKTDEGTLLQKVGDPEWKPLQAFPEFGGDPTVAQDAPSARRPAGTSRRSRGHGSDQPTSGMAIASLVFGVLGVTAPLGLVLGILAQLKISRGHVPLKGAGYAISGMVVSGIMLLFGIPILIGLLVPGWVRAREEAYAEQCLQRAGILATALTRYAAEHEGRFPNYETWCDDLLQSPFFEYSRIAFICPAEPQVRSGFALNTNLVDQVASSLNPKTVLFFESKAGWNGHGGFPQLANYRHRGKVTVGFVDGRVQDISVWQIPQLRWLP